jgi:hypothetical protein
VIGDKVRAKYGSMVSNQRHYENTQGIVVKDYGDGDFKVNFGGYDDFCISGEYLTKEPNDEQSPSSRA